MVKLPWLAWEALVREGLALGADEGGLGVGGILAEDAREEEESGVPETWGGVWKGRGGVEEADAWEEGRGGGASDGAVGAGGEGLGEGIWWLFVGWADWWTRMFRKTVLQLSLRRGGKERCSILFNHLMAVDHSSLKVAWDTCGLDFISSKTPLSLSSQCSNIIRAFSWAQTLLLAFNLFAKASVGLQGWRCFGG